MAEPSTREERVAIATRLRGEGLKLREISERTGAPISTVHELISDPDLAKHHARLDRYRGTCKDCGKRTSWPSRGNKAPERCDGCARKASQFWTQEKIIAAIQEWAERYGQPPSATHWNPPLARKNGHDDWAERFYAGRWPHATTLQERFGSWNAAIEAAGFTPRRSGQRHWPGESA